MRARSSLISLMVVPECIFRFATPLYSSTTADSIRYHDPSVIAGAFALAHTTKRIAPDSSAMIPLWAMAGEAGAERATTLPSKVTHSPGAALAIVFSSVPPPLLPPVPDPAEGRLYSLASSFVTLRSASDGWTPNSCTSLRSLPSIFFGSAGCPSFENFREILSAASEKSILIHLQLFVRCYPDYIGLVCVVKVSE